MAGLLDWFFNREATAQDQDIQRLAARDQLMQQTRNELGRDLTLGERAAVNRGSVNLTPSQEALARTVRETNEGTAALARAPNTAAAAVARLPVTIPELGDLAVQVGQTLMDDSGRSFGERFSDARFGREGTEQLQRAREQNIRRYRAENPNATQEQVQEADDAYTRSAEYGDIETRNLGTVRRAIQGVGEAIDTTFGAPVDREKTTADRIIGGIASGIAPTGGLIRALGLSGRAATAANLALPGAMGGSTSNYALNAAIGAGLPLAFDAATQRGMAIAAAEEPGEQRERARAQATSDMVTNTQPDANDPNDRSEFGILSTTLAGFGLLAAIGSARVQGLNRATAAVRRMSNTETAVGRVFDQQATIEQQLVNGGRSRQEARQTIGDLNTSYAAADNTARYMDTGQHAYLQQPSTFRFPILDRLRQAIDQRGDLEQVEEAIAGLSAIDSRTFQQKNLQERLSTLRQQQAQAADRLSRIQTANSMATTGTKLETQAEATALSRITRQIDDVTTQLDEAMQDLPTSRMQMPQYSLADLQNMAAKYADDDLFQQYRRMLAQGHQDQLTIRTNAGLLDATDAQRMRAANPNYSPMRHDLLENKTGFARIAEKIKRSIGEGAALDEEISAARMASRTYDDVGSIPMEDRVTKTMPLVDQLVASMRRTNFEVAQNNLRRGMIKELEAVGAIQPRAVSGKSNVLNPRAPFFAEKMAKDERIVSYIEGGKHYVYTAPTPEIAQAIKHNPDQWDWFTRMSGGANAWLRKGLTGALNPAFATANYMYDLGATMLREANKTFGLGNMVERVAGKRVGQAVDVAMRTSGLSWVDPAIHIPAAINTLRLVFHAQGQRIASRIAADITAQFGLINKLASSSPKVKAMFESIAQGLTRVLEEGMVSKYVHDVGQQTPHLEEMSKFRKEVDSFISSRATSSANNQVMGTGNVPGAVWSLYKDMLWSVHNTMRFTYYTQQVAAETARAGKPLTVQQMHRLATDARTITGDLRKRSDLKLVRLANQHTNYFNIGLQAARTMYQRMTEDPRVAAMMISGVATPIAFSTAYINSSPELSNWWHREVPDWEKDRFMFLPTPQGIVKWANGETPTREDIHRILTPPDFQFIRGAIRTTMEYLGASPGYRPADIQAPTAQEVIRGSVGSFLSNFVPQPSSLMNAAAALGGLQIDARRTMNPSDSRGVFTMFDTNERMNRTSIYSRGFNEVMGAVLGGFGKSVADALDTGEQNVRLNGSDYITAYLGYGTQDAAQQMLKPRSDAPGAVIMNERVYANNPTRVANRELREALTLSSSRQMPGAKKIEGAGQPLNDPVLETVRGLIDQYGNRDPQMRDVNRQRRELYTGRAAALANKAATYNERQSQVNEINRQIIDIEASQNKLLTDFQATIAASPLGQQYQQLYGRPFSLRDWREKAAAAYRNQQYSRRQTAAR